MPIEMIIMAMRLLPRLRSTPQKYLSCRYPSAPPMITAMMAAGMSWSPTVRLKK